MKILQVCTISNFNLLVTAMTGLKADHVTNNEQELRYMMYPTKANIKIITALMFCKKQKKIMTQVQSTALLFNHPLKAHHLLKPTNTTFHTNLKT